MIADKGFVQTFGALKIQLRDPRLFNKGLDQLAKDCFVAEQAFIAAIMQRGCHLCLPSYKSLFVFFVQFCANHKQLKGNGQLKGQLVGKYRSGAPSTSQLYYLLIPHSHSTVSEKWRTHLAYSTNQNS